MWRRRWLKESTIKANWSVNNSVILELGCSFVAGTGKSDITSTTRAVCPTGTQRVKEIINAFFALSDSPQDNDLETGKYKCERLFWNRHKEFYLVLSSTTTNTEAMNSATSRDGPSQSNNTQPAIQVKSAWNVFDTKTLGEMYPNR